jgi:hypothetical protein
MDSLGKPAHIRNREPPRCCVFLVSRLNSCYHHLTSTAYLVVYHVIHYLSIGALNEFALNANQ